jgi:hypothetical protein
MEIALIMNINNKGLVNEKVLNSRVHHQIIQKASNIMIIKVKTVSKIMNMKNPEKDHLSHSIIKIINIFLSKTEIKYTHITLFVQRVIRIPQIIHANITKNSQIYQKSTSIM